MVSAVLRIHGIWLGSILYLNFWIETRCKSHIAFVGYFGSGVGAYFSFLRRIFILNLLLVLLILLPFVVIPQVSHNCNLHWMALH